MVKAAGVAAVAAMMSASAMTVLAGALGAYAEITALGMMGVGMVAAGQLFGRAAGAEPVAGKQPVNG